jgi:hypothetical protein
MAGEPADAFYQKEISPNGPQVRFEEMRWTGTLFALLSPRTSFLDSFRVADDTPAMSLRHSLQGYMIKVVCAKEE